MCVTVTVAWRIIFLLPFQLCKLKKCSVKKLSYWKLQRGVCLEGFGIVHPHHTFQGDYMQNDQNVASFHQELYFYLLFASYLSCSLYPSIFSFFRTLSQVIFLPTYIFLFLTTVYICWSLDSPRTLEPGKHDISQCLLHLDIENMILPE